MPHETPLSKPSPQESPLLEDLQPVTLPTIDWVDTSEVPEDSGQGEVHREDVSQPQELPVDEDLKGLIPQQPDWILPPRGRRKNEADSAAGAYWENVPQIDLPSISPRQSQGRIGRRALLREGNLASWAGPDFNRHTGIEGTFSIELPNDFELTMTDAVRQRIKEYGWRQARKDFEDLTAQLLSDTHGETNIDHFKDTDAGRFARHVHRVEGPLAGLMGDTPLALKSTGVDVAMAEDMGLGRRTGLREQFRSTLFARRAFEKKAEEEGRSDGMIAGGTIGIVDIYGVLSHRDTDGKLQEWMLMERIDDAEPMENRRIALATFGGPQVALGFTRGEHPELAAFYDKHDAPWGHPYGIAPDSDYPIEYSDIAKYLYKELDIKEYSKVFDDLNGNNILVREEPDGSKKYFLIDVQSH